MHSYMIFVFSLSDLLHTVQQALGPRPVKRELKSERKGGM